MRRTPVIAVLCCAAIAALARAEEPPAKPVTPDAFINEGRGFFQRADFAAAQVQFEQALSISPDHKDALFLAGLAAYWARKPEAAFRHWTRSLDLAKRNTAGEWEVEKHRLMALSAMGQHEAAEVVAERLRELRRDPNLPAAASAKGFVREHLYAKKLRAGVWQSFDEAAESRPLWTLNVVDLEKNDAAVVRKLAVIPLKGPNGNLEFAFQETSPELGAEFGRWKKLPPYPAVHAAALRILEGSVDSAPAAVIAAATAQAPSVPSMPDPVPEKKDPPPATVPAPIKLAIPPAVQQLLNVAERLRDVKFDVAHLARISETNPAEAERLINEMNARHPNAQNDSKILLDGIAQAKQKQHVDRFFNELLTRGERQPYLDFTLLMALEARMPSKAPAAYLDVCLASADTMVRQRAAAALARQGDRRGLEQLIKDLDAAPPADCAILMVTLEPLIGNALGAVPPDAAAVDEWKRGVKKWWETFGPKMVPLPKPTVAGPYWTVGDQK